MWIIPTTDGTTPDYAQGAFRSAPVGVACVEVSDADWLAYLAGVEDAKPLLPDWKGFAVWARDDTALNTAITTALPLKPIAAGGIGATLLQASQGDLDNFASYFETVCIAANVSTQQRAAWADLARDTYHLPSDFVSVVRGAS